MSMGFQYANVRAGLMETSVRKVARATAARRFVLKRWLLGWTTLLAVLSCDCVSLAADQAPVADQNSVMVLSAGSLWRKYYGFVPPRLSEKAAQELKIDFKNLDEHYRALKFKGKNDSFYQLPPPPADWAKPEFDDSGWHHRPAVDLLAEEVRVPNSADAYSRGTDAFFPTLIGYTAMRGKFIVKDKSKVKKMALSMTLRGGCVVYLNGKEAARFGMPGGTIDWTTPATTEYPDDAFGIKEASGKRTPLHWYNHGGAEFKDKWALRETKTGPLEIDARLLKDGLNVIAIESHRSALPAIAASSGLTFNPLGIGELFLTADTSADNIQSSIHDPVETARLTNCDVFDRTTTGYLPDPVEPLRPMAIPALRNGAFSGKTVLTSPSDIEGLSATLDGLKGAGGEIPPANVQIRYEAVSPVNPGFGGSRLDGLNAQTFDILLERAPSKIEACAFSGRPGAWDQPNAAENTRKSLGLPMPLKPRAVAAIWITVKPPKDAKPGLYKGTLSVSAKGITALSIPVEVNVSGWTLPDPKDYQTFLNLYQSPETLAVYYKVKPWSEEHWKLVEKSLQWCGEVGNATLFLLLTAQSSHGNPYSWVVWQKQADGRFKYDFSIVERYLTTAMKYHHPDRIKGVIARMFGPECFPKQSNACWGQNFSLYTETDGSGKRTNQKVPQSGETYKGNGASTNDSDPALRLGPAFEEFWRPVLQETKKRLQKYKLETKLYVGEANDYQPSAEYCGAFERTMPGMPWFKTTHCAATAFRTDPADKSKTVLVGISTAVWGGDIPDPKGKRFYGWSWVDNPGRTVIVNFNRAGCCNLCLNNFSPPWCHRGSMEADMLNGRNGMGNIGADFFAVDWKEAAKQFEVYASDATGVRRMYSCFLFSSQVNTGIDYNCAAVLAPGPDYPLATSRFENMRMGILEAEARCLIERAIVGKKIPDDLAKKCQDLLDLRVNALRLYAVDYYQFSTVPLGLKGFQDWTQSSQRLFELAATVDQATRRR